MDDKTKNIQPEIENLNLEEIDVEELEKRLELAVATTSGWGCNNKDCNTFKISQDPDPAPGGGSNGSSFGVDSFLP
jgi:hypothetical protein